MRQEESTLESGRSSKDCFLTCKDQILSSPPIPPDTRVMPLEQNERDFTAPTEGAIQPAHQQALSCSVLTCRWLVQNPQAEGVSPAEGCDPRHLSLHMTGQPGSFPLDSSTQETCGDIDLASHCLTCPPY
ncbi:hypothetical protein INR49_025862 [Caranx melampygus]|nr:hypothetical protein INR49_025862 [Caranx melampygus]